MNLERVAEAIRRHEGFRAKVYRDSVGIPTIGYGRNLTDPGISIEEAEYLLRHDLARAVATARGFTSRVEVGGFESLPEVVQEVLVNMAFNLGLRLTKFEGMRKAIEDRDWARMAEEMKSSVWYRQVGKRAEELRSAVLSLVEG